MSSNNLFTPSSPTKNKFLGEEHLVGLKPTRYSFKRNDYQYCRFSCIFPSFRFKNKINSAYSYAILYYISYIRANLNIFLLVPILKIGQTLTF